MTCKYQKGSINYYSYKRGFIAGEKGEDPKERSKAYMEGYRAAKANIDLTGILLQNME